MEHGLFFSLLLIQGAAFITTAVHELGHAVAAFALKMKVRHFRLGPCEASLKGGTWQFRFHPAGILSATGAVGAVPVTLEDLRIRNILLYAAGPIASFCLGVVALWATLGARSQPWAQSWELLSYVTTFALLGFVFNLVPMGLTDGQYSDGARIYQMLSQGPCGDVTLVFSMISSTLVSSLRPRDTDIRMIERAADFLSSGQKAFLMRNYSWMHYFDSGRIFEARRAIAELESVYNRSALNLSVDLHMETIFANAFVKQDAVAARLWWDRMEAKRTSLPDPVKEQRNLMQSSVDYWKACCSLHLIEGRMPEAETAWERGQAIAAARPSAGAYDFDRDCFTHLRRALDESLVPLHTNLSIEAA